MNCSDLKASDKFLECHTRLIIAGHHRPRESMRPLSRSGGKQRMQPSWLPELMASVAGSELGCYTTDTGKFSCILFFNRKGEGLSEEFS